MKLTYEAHGHKYTVENNDDNVDIHEVGHLLTQLLLAGGFQPETVREILGEEGT